MALSGMITFGLLVVLIDCVNGQPKHPDSVVIRTRGKAAMIKCEVDSSTLQSNALHWYRAPPNGALQRLIYFDAGSTTPKKDPDAPRSSRYAGSVKDKMETAVNDKKDKVVTLTISRLELSDAGWYYCALWSEDNNTVITIRGNHYKNLLLSSVVLFGTAARRRH